MGLIYHIPLSFVYSVLSDTNWNMPCDPRSIDEFLGTFRSRQRRWVMSFFDESDHETAHLDELVQSLLARDDDTTESDRVRLNLHHKTLPVLANAGLVEYDDLTRRVRYRADPCAEAVWTHISELEGAR